MTSTDNEILVKIYEGQVQIIQRLDGVEYKLTSLDSRVGALEAEQKAQRTELSSLRKDFTEFKGEVGTQLTIIRHDQANLQTSVYWVLGAIGIIVAALAIPSVVQSWRSLFTDRPTRAELKDLMREVVREMQPTTNS